MALGTSSREPIDALVERVLGQLSRGHAPSSIELERVDFKEEGGRRARDGSVSPGETTNEQGRYPSGGGDGLHGEHARWRCGHSRRIE